MTAGPRGRQEEATLPISELAELTWEDVRDLASHVTWMADAESIRFTSERTSGVGTTFD